MSSLSLPRIIFQGTTSWDPNTVNNGAASYDEISVQPELGGMTLEQYSHWLFQMAPPGSSNSGNLNGSWNVFGGYSVQFEASVTGTQLIPLSMGANDPLIGLPVTIEGALNPQNQKITKAQMVDVDPFSPYTTQIIYTTLSIGDSNVGVSGTGACRMFSRWPNMSRNLGVDPGIGHAGTMGVIWQAALPKEALSWGQDYASSPVLLDLYTLLHGQLGTNPNPYQGLVFLFASYCTLYFQSAIWNGQTITTPQELGLAYQNGFKGSNPAISTMLGRVGIWGPGELASAPTDILLAPPPPPPSPSAPVRSRPLAQGREIALLQASPQQASLGPAQARLVDLVASKVLVLDLLSTFPEQDETLAKADLGSFELQVVSSDGTSTPILTLTSEQYGQQAYESKGGIVELVLAGNPGLADLIAQGTLQLVSIPSPNASFSPGTVVLEQVPLVTDSDQRGIWVDQGQTVKVQVATYQNGVTPPAGTVQVLMAPYSYDSQNNQFSQITAASQAVFELSDGNGNPLPLAPVLAVGSDGTSTFSVTPVQAGFCTYFFFPFAGSVQPTPPVTIGTLAPDCFFIALRGLPFDDVLAETPASEVTWQFLYQNVLSTWDVVYPLMSTIIPLSDEATVESKACAAAIIQRLGEDPLQSSLYMPVSRDMSAGKRALLVSYLTPFAPPPSGGSESAAGSSSPASGQASGRG